MYRIQKNPHRHFSFMSDVNAHLRCKFTKKSGNLRNFVLGK